MINNKVINGFFVISTWSISDYILSKISMNLKNNAKHKSPRTIRTIDMTIAKILPFGGELHAESVCQFSL